MQNSSLDFLYINPKIESIKRKTQDRIMNHIIKTWEKLDDYIYKNEDELEYEKYLKFYDNYFCKYYYEIFYEKYTSTEYDKTQKYYLDMNENKKIQKKDPIYNIINEYNLGKQFFLYYLRLFDKCNNYNDISQNWTIENALIHFIKIFNNFENDIYDINMEWNNLLSMYCIYLIDNLSSTDIFRISHLHVYVRTMYNIRILKTFRNLNDIEIYKKENIDFQNIFQFYIKNYLVNLSSFVLDYIEQIMIILTSFPGLRDIYIFDKVYHKIERKYKTVRAILDKKSNLYNSMLIYQYDIAKFIKDNLNEFEKDIGFYLTSKYKGITLGFYLFIIHDMFKKHFQYNYWIYWVVLLKSWIKDEEKFMKFSKKIPLIVQTKLYEYCVLYEGIFYESDDFFTLIEFYFSKFKCFPYVTNIDEIIPSIIDWKDLLPNHVNLNEISNSTCEDVTLDFWKKYNTIDIIKNLNDIEEIQENIFEELERNETIDE
jgi:hypothetical protein